LPFRCDPWQPVTATLNAVREGKDAKYRDNIRDVRCSYFYDRVGCIE
jgi:hypothetical protein